MKQSAPGRKGSEEALRFFIPLNLRIGDLCYMSCWLLTCRQVAYQYGFRSERDGIDRAV